MKSRHTRHTDRGRSTASLARRGGSRTPKEAILIVCEDAVSAPDYFNSIKQQLRLQTADVVVHGEECGSDPRSVVEYAIQFRNKRKREAKNSPATIPFDEVWCVIDKDQHPNLAEALDLARAHKLRIALSIPCFEYWYLLHFEETERPHQKCGDLIRKDLKQHLPKYNKGKSVFDKVWPHTIRAIKRAARITERQGRQRHTDGDFANPSTSLHLLIQRLLEIELPQIRLAKPDHHLWLDQPALAGLRLKQRTAYILSVNETPVEFLPFEDGKPGLKASGKNASHWNEIPRGTQVTLRLGYESAWGWMGGNRERD